jgi:RimJ/RimL family protein N-acetyltransferase
MDGSPPVSIPRLQTKRLTLREYRMPDFDAFAAHVVESGYADRKDAWRMFGCNTGSWLLQGAGWWAVEVRETEEPVGTVGAFFREGSQEIEIGWNTYRAFRGRGFASEAAAEAVRYALEVRGEQRVTALIRPGNAPSLRVASHLGMRHEADVELWGEQVGRHARAQ